ncbi:MAG: ATP synthase subunit C [Lachnospiraceae bacterium]
MLLVLAPMAILGTAFYVVRKKSQGRPVKRAVGMNLAVFAVLVVLMSVLCFNVFAAEDAQPADTAAAQTAETAQTQSDSSKGMGLLAAGLVTGLAGIGGGIAVAAGAPAAIAATAENPKSFGKSIIFVALGESIALYGVVISILILNKV